MKARLDTKGVRLDVYVNDEMDKFTDQLGKLVEELRRERAAR